MFKNREEAAMLLAKKTSEKLKKRKIKQVIVIALTRGAVKMGKIISDYLSVPFDVIVVKKIGAPAPFSSELAIGAIASSDSVFFNEEIIRELRITEREILELKKKKEIERKRLEKLFKRKKGKLDLKGKNIILVDDGIATGASVAVASIELKRRGVNKVILASPVAASESLRGIKKYFDDFIILKKEKFFRSVGEYYEEFPQITNEEVIDLLR